MKRVELVYVVHFQDLTGKPDEILETGAETAGALIAELDARYPGFQALLLREGGFRAQNAMVLYHKGARAHCVYDPSHPIGDGDYITFL